MVALYNVSIQSYSTLQQLLHTIFIAIELQIGDMLPPSFLHNLSAGLVKATPGLHREEYRVLRYSTTLRIVTHLGLLQMHLITHK